MRQISFHDPLVKQWIGFSLIALAVLIAYSPSLLHIPRGDQIGYLAEVRDKHSLWDLTVGSYDLNRQRQFAPGDQLLFRPGVYFILGAEQFFFGNNFILWQLFGIVMHLAVIWQLLALLLELRAGFGAIVAAGFFALLSSNMEMVIWDQISTYMVFLFCLLKILRLMLYDQMTTRDWIVMLGALFVMCFSYESGNVYSLVIFIWIWWKYPRQRVRAWLLLLPMVSYAALNAWNFWGVHGAVAPEAHDIIKLSLNKTFLNAVIMLQWWLFQGLFPSQIIWNLGERNMFDPHKMLFPIPTVNWQEPFVWIAIVLLVVLAVLFFQRMTLERKKKPLTLWIGNVTVLLLIFLVLITVGRSNPRGLEETIFKNIYYAYFFWLMMVMIGYALLSRITIQKRDKFILAFLVILLTLHNGVNLYQNNQRQANASNQTLVLLRTLNLLIASKGQEPGFSFYVAPTFPGNFKCSNVRRSERNPDDVYSFMEIIYPQYFRTKNPKYNFMTSS